MPMVPRHHVPVARSPINTEKPMMIPSESDSCVTSLASSGLDWSADDTREVVAVVVARKALKAKMKNGSTSSERS